MTPLRLYEPGYKKRYYQQKFGVSETDDEFRRKWAFLLSIPAQTRLTPVQSLAKHYVEGMAWVLHYYYQGVSSVPPSHISLLTRQ